VANLTWTRSLSCRGIHQIARRRPFEKRAHGVMPTLNRELGLLMDRISLVDSIPDCDYSTWRYTCSWANAMSSASVDRPTGDQSSCPRTSSKPPPIKIKENSKRRRWASYSREMININNVRPYNNINLLLHCSQSFTWIQGLHTSICVPKA
jgi:hypothetical protein